jgi:uncharacterized protein (UPF0332 family)
MFDTAVNRAYYSIFHALKAVLEKDGIKRVKHSGVISAANQFYINNHILTIPQNLVKTSSDFRHKSDYYPNYSAARETAAEQVTSAQTVLRAVEDYLVLAG